MIANNHWVKSILKEIGIFIHVHVCRILKHYMNIQLNPWSHVHMIVLVLFSLTTIKYGYNMPGFSNLSFSYN